MRKGSRKPSIVCCRALQLNCVQEERIWGEKMSILMPECPHTEERALFCSPSGCRSGQLRAAFHSRCLGSIRDRP